MISLGNQNQFPFFFAPLGGLLKTLMFLSNLNGFNAYPSLLDQGFTMERFFQGVEGKRLQVI